MPQWASNTGRAIDKHTSAQRLVQTYSHSLAFGLLSAVLIEKRAHTDAHHNQEPCTESPKIHHRTSSTLHKVIGIGTSPAYPIRQRSDYIGRHDEQGQVAMEEGGGQDDEEEAYSKDLMDDVLTISQDTVVGEGDFGRREAGRSIRRIMR